MMKYITGILVFSILTIPMAFAESLTDRELPQVLIIGDSISLQYTPFVIEQLEGIADVVHNKGNAGPTQRGVENIDSWLGDTVWDVIHFNWGLWDMYHWRYWEFDQTPVNYERNLEMLVTRLERTGAKLIWATTTPACPGPEIKQQVLVDPQTEKRYLDAAIRVMKNHNIMINDLNAFLLRNRSKYSKGDNDVHYTGDGSKALAKLVSNKIKEALD